MGGQIIGGVTSGGQAFGTKAGQSQPQGQPQSGPSWKQPMTSPGGVSATPRLDAGLQPSGIGSMRGAATAGESFAQTDARKRRESAASGAFGKGAQNKEVQRPNIAGRQALYADMKSAFQVGITPEMEARCTALGVSGPAWKRTAGSIASRAPWEPSRIAAAIGAVVERLRSGVLVLRRVAAPQPGRPGRERGTVPAVS